MSISEDCELQELVKQTLEKSGSMSKIRAELRASVFLALEENGCFQSMKIKNTNLQNFSKTTDGVLLLCLVREFLEYFGLSFTSSVFNPELASYGIYCNCQDRAKLKSQLNVTSMPVDDTDGPVLSQMLKVIRNIQNLNKYEQNHEIFDETNNLENRKSSDSSTEYLPLHCSTNTNSKEPDFNQKTEKKLSDVHVSHSDLTNLRSTDESKSKLTSAQTTNEKNIEAPKYNLSSLDNLPPLTSSFNLSKSCNNSLISKQINNLKATLKDNMTESNADPSIADQENRNSLENSLEFQESIATESNITAEDQSTS